MRDCVNRLKQYINCCPDDEKPSQGRLISIFLEGLRNKTLHVHLYARKHATFNACCTDAMDYNDNFDMKNLASLDIKKDSKDLSANSSSQTPSMNPKQIVDIVLKKLGQTYRPGYLK